MSMPAGPTPDKVMQVITGGWAAAILGSAAKHGIFNALEDSGDDAAGVARKTGIAHVERKRRSTAWPVSAS